MTRAEISLSLRRLNVTKQDDDYQGWHIEWEDDDFHYRLVAPIGVTYRRFDTAEQARESLRELLLDSQEDNDDTTRKKPR